MDSVGSSLVLRRARKVRGVMREQDVPQGIQQTRTLSPSGSVTGCTSSAATIDTLNILCLVLHLRLRYTADTRRAEIRLLGLHAPQAAELFMESQH